MSTYITALCAGPYHEVRDSHDGIDLGVFCRASMTQYLDADDILLVTKQGFDFFHRSSACGTRCPSTTRCSCPSSTPARWRTSAASSTPSSTTSSARQVTDFEYEQRANTILHEMAHMWFGDLVTMRWWDDLWLNESFAEWASHWCNTAATRFTDAWTTFLSVRKNWGYRQDQLSSTHPVYCEMPDVEAVEVNFDGITYAKGASVIKQLVAYVGIEPFLAGLRAYFAKHAWGNATFDDLLSALEAASGRELRKFAAQWLETAQVNTLRPEIEIAADGTYASVAVLQEAPADYPTLRTHRIGVGLYDLRRRPAGPPRAHRGRHRRRPDRDPALVGMPRRRRPAAQRRRPHLRQAAAGRAVDGHRRATTSAASTTRWPGPCAGRRRGTWSATPNWPPATTSAGRAAACRPRTTSTWSPPPCGRPSRRWSLYADPAWAPDRLASSWPTLRRPTRWPPPSRAAASSSPGRGRSRPARAARTTWPRCAAGSTASACPTGLRDRGRPALERAAVAGRQGRGRRRDEIEAELDTDRTASGEREAALARALRAHGRVEGGDLAARSPSDRHLPNWLQRSMLQGFQHSAQTELTAPYAAEYFEVVGRGLGDPRQRAGAGVRRCWPTRPSRSPRTRLRRTDAWLAAATATRRPCGG